MGVPSGYLDRVGLTQKQKPCQTLILLKNKDNTVETRAVEILTFVAFATPANAVYSPEALLAIGPGDALQPS